MLTQFGKCTELKNKLGLKVLYETAGIPRTFKIPECLRDARRQWKYIKESFKQKTVTLA